MAKKPVDDDGDATPASLPTSNNNDDQYLQLTEPVLGKDQLEEPLPEFDSYKQDFYTSSPVKRLDDHTDDAMKIPVSNEDNLEEVVDELANHSLLDGLQDQEFVQNEIVTALISSGDRLHGQQQQQQEIDTLKEKLDVSLSSLKEVEQELLDSQFQHEQQLKSLNASHAAELERVQEKHRMVVEKLANEVSAQPPAETNVASQMQQPDRDEIEMERLKLIKDSLKENYEREKNELRESLVTEHQEKMESFKQQMEENANAQLQEYHKQYLAAYEEQTKQKTEAEAALLQTLDAKELEYREKLFQLQQRISKLEEMLSQAKEEKQLEVAALSKSHSDQLNSIQLGKQELENHLKEQIEQWKSKAASLEQHLLNSTSKNVVSPDTESIEQLKTNYEEKLDVAIQEKSQLESQLLSQINALNEELSREKQKQELSIKEMKDEVQQLNEEFTREKQKRELSIKEKDDEVQRLTAELERVNQGLQSKETAATNASREIVEMKHQHEEALEELRVSLTEAHEMKLIASQKELQVVSSQLKVLSDQMVELNESKHDALSQLEETQRQVSNLQSSLAQSNEEKQQLIKDYENQTHSLKDSMRDLQISNQEVRFDFEKDADSYKGQISHLETALNETKLYITQLKSEFESKELKLQTELMALREQKVSEPQTSLFTELGTEVLQKAENLTSSRFTSTLELIKKLLATLESRASDVLVLQDLNKSLVSQMSELQVNVSEDKPSTTEVDLLRAYEQLQVSYEELKDSSNVEIENLKSELREREKTVSSLEKKLQTTNFVSVELQDEFGRECARYESERESLEQAVKETMVPKEALDDIVSAQAKEIEQKFEQERQALITKINEKETLEAELTTRKIELEKRLTEKAKLEEVLAEKSRLEQELRAQKVELEHELFEIEGKLKSRENEIQQERSDWSMKLSEKDSTIHLVQEKLQQQDEIFLQKEKQLKNSHDQEVQKLLTEIEHSNLKTKEVVDKLKTTQVQEITTLRNEMDERNSQALNELEVRLNKSHQEELGELKEKHSVEVI